MTIDPKLKLLLLIQTAICEAESKYHVKIATNIYNDFINMPEDIYNLMVEDNKDEPESMAYIAALDFADYEYEMFAGDFTTVPAAHDIYAVLPRWLIEYIKWKPKKTKQDEEVLEKVKLADQN